MTSKSNADAQSLIVTAFLAGGAFTWAVLNIFHLFSRDEYTKIHSNLTPTQVLYLIRKRRSIFPKQYTGKSVASSIINDMIEAARWAPTHQITQPWRFIVFESYESRLQLGRFLAEAYKKEQELAGKEVLASKYEKKMASTASSSHVIALVVDVGKKNPVVEEIASVASAAQNMQLVATSYRVGAYWSTGCIYQGGEKLDFQDGVMMDRFNPDMKIFLNLEKSQFCIGLLYVGDLGDKMKWPSGSRAEMNNDKVTWL